MLVQCKEVSCVILEILCVPALRARRKTVSHGHSQAKQDRWKAPVIFSGKLECPTPGTALTFSNWIFPLLTAAGCSQLSRIQPLPSLEVS